MFSCDVLAAEAQIAPLWEEVNKQNEELSEQRKRESKEQKKGSSSQKRKLRFTPQTSQHSRKRRRMTPTYTECKLCELTFKSELELETHLFSILHHRSLNTEWGDCRHQCNLCGISCNNLSSYVQHLLCEEHGRKNEKRKAAIRAGTYLRPENHLGKYTSTFLCPPKKAKELKREEKINKKISRIFPKEAETSRLNSKVWRKPTERPYSQGHTNGKYLWDQTFPYFNQSRCKSEYPDWHPRGVYGDNLNDFNLPRQKEFPQDYYNPYESGWSQGYYQRTNSGGRRTEDSVIYSRERKYQTNTHRKNGFLPASARLAKPSRRSRSLTHDQARTKELVARAHQVIQNGKKRPRRRKKRIKTMPKTSNRTKSLETSSRDNSLASTSSAPPDRSFQNCKRIAGSEMSLKSDSSFKIESTASPAIVSSKTTNNTISPKELPIAIRLNKAARSPSSTNALFGLNSSFASSSGSPVLERLEKLRRNASFEKKTEMDIREKFQKQIDNELGPARVKKPLKSPSQTMTKITIMDVSPRETKKDCAEKVATEPATTENIREKFRKILDDIDKPIASASEILTQGQTVGETDASVDLQETSWADSSIVSQRNDVPSGPIRSILNKPQNNVKTKDDTATTTTVSPNSTHYTSLPDLGGQHKLSPTKTKLEIARTFSTESVTSSFATPSREIITISSASDADTPKNKKRTQPRPNLNKARARITSKQKESPDTPAEVRQAKLKRLLQKYERAKKNLPDLNDLTKMTGPRFGIELNLQSKPLDVVDVEALAKNSELVEILSEKRVRSLSENDTVASFATAATESSASLFASTDKGDLDEKKELEQRTSTPALPPQTHNLNTKLLSMSEREETLHASVRSLAMQEANVQSEIDNKNSLLLTLQAELEKLKERKLCVEALKRRNEDELEALRQERLLMLRGTICSPHYVSPSLGTIFQEVTPNCRRTTSALENTKISSVNQTLETSFGELCNQIDTQSSEKTIPNIRKDDSVSVGTSQGTSGPNYQYEAKICTKITGAQDFSISKVKSEKCVPADSALPFPEPSENEILRNGTHTFNVKVENSHDTSLENQSTFDASQERNSTKFFSFRNDATQSTSFEVDRILSKYVPNHPSTKNATDSSSNDGSSPNVKKCRKKKKQPTASIRRSPRNLPGSKQEPLSNQRISPQEKIECEIHENITGNSLESVEVVNKLPRMLKLHNEPLVGMDFVKEGLVTCSLDRTLLLHSLNGEKYTLKLGATPTAICAASEEKSLVFVATQKLLSKTQSSNDSIVINKMEHWINIFLVVNFKERNGVKDTTFRCRKRVKMKTRVLCVHYDKQLLFCGMRDGSAAIISLESSRSSEDEIVVIECHAHSAITCMTTGTEGPRRILCCGSTDCSISVRDATDGLLLRTIQGHTKTVTCLQLVHNELFSASVDRLVLGHDLITGNLLHRFTGHAGIVRSLYVLDGVMLTLCSDRNIRFFDTKTSRLLQKPKAVASLPLHVAVPTVRKCAVYVGCEDSTVILVKFPSTNNSTLRSGISPARNINSESPPENMKLRSSTKNFNSSSPGRNSKSPSKRSKVASKQSPIKVVNLTGEYECQWGGCVGAGTFCSENDLRNHILSDHMDVCKLANSRDWTLRGGACCQWNSCTHYFAPELDTVKDITAHVQRHLEKKSPNQKEIDWSDIDADCVVLTRTNYKSN